MGTLAFEMYLGYGVWSLVKIFVKCRNLLVGIILETEITKDLIHLIYYINGVMIS